MSLSAPPPPLWVFLPLPRWTKAEPLARVLDALAEPPL